jgi:kynurenine formamidase
VSNEAPGANWGKWGASDELGALNRLSAESTRRGLAASSTGEVLSLAVPLVSGRGPVAGARPTMQHYMTRDGGDYAAGLRERGFGYADDVVLLATHGNTHIDALSHIWESGKMWNGFGSNTVTSRGAMKCGIDKVPPIVTRGVFVDFGPPDGSCLTDDHAITLDDLVASIVRLNVKLQSGDVLLIRTGWLSRWRAGESTETRWAGLHPECAAWIDEQGVVVVGADNIAVEYGPSPIPNDAAPLHVELLRNRGVLLMELMDLEVLASRRRSEFLFMVSPLPIQGGVGSPVNPVAVL